jgi:hypothetical protein
VLQKEYILLQKEFPKFVLQKKYPMLQNEYVFVAEKIPPLSYWIGLGWVKSLCTFRENLGLYLPRKTLIFYAKF